MPSPAWFLKALVVSLVAMSATGTQAHQEPASRMRASNAARAGSRESWSATAPARLAKAPLSGRWIDTPAAATAESASAVAARHEARWTATDSSAAIWSQRRSSGRRRRQLGSPIRTTSGTAVCSSRLR